MPKKLKVSDSGDELEIPQDHIIEVSYSKAKQLMKKPREMSEKQRDNIQRLVAMNKEKKAERDRLKQEQERSVKEQEAPKQKLIVKPKRIFKKKQELPSTNEYIEQKIKRQQYAESDEESDEEESDDEVEVQTITKPVKSKSNKIVEMENKLKQIEQSINKPVQKLNKYDSMVSKFWCTGIGKK
jgi:hypothetical protein